MVQPIVKTTILPICIIGSSVMTFSACSTPTPIKNAPSINTLVVKNLTRNDINDVEIRVEKLNGVFNCNLIIPESYCSNGFKERHYENNQITISWVEKNQPYAIGPIAIDISQSLIKLNKSNQQPYTAVIEVQNDGEFDAYFKLPNPK